MVRNLRHDSSLRFASLRFANGLTHAWGRKEITLLHAPVLSLMNSTQSLRVR